MPITNQDDVTQALVNIRLESLSLSSKVLDLIEKSLNDKSITTTDILNLMRG